MRTLRLLAWLRWTLFLRASSVSNRWGAIGLNVMLALAFSPFWFGGALLAYGGTLRFGAPAALVVFGASQITWIYFGLLLGAMGRSFDLDRLTRYPLRAESVYATNILAACLEPVCLMTLPAIFAAAAGAFARAGAGPGAATLAAGLIVTLVTSALLQLLLAVLDEVMRREWVRYLAIALFSLTFILFQLVVRGSAQRLIARLAGQPLDPGQMVGLIAGYLAKLPTVGWPGAIATGALDGSPLRLLAGLAGTALLAALLISPGARLMRHTARAGETSGGAGPAKRPSSRGSVALLPGILPRGVGLLVARELRYSLTSPQRLLALFLTPLVLLMLLFTRKMGRTEAPVFVLLLLSSSLSSTAITQFSYDGPGVRSFFLLPCRARDVLLAKNLDVFFRMTVQLALVLAPLTVFRRTQWDALGSVAMIGAAAVVFGVVALGTWVSIRWPVRARRRGLSTRGDSGWGGLVVFLGVAAIIGVVFGVVWAARGVAGPAFAAPAGIAVSTVMLAAAAATWWVSLDRNAGALLGNRERLIEVIAKVEEV